MSALPTEPEQISLVHALILGSWVAMCIFRALNGEWLRSFDAAAFATIFWAYSIAIRRADWLEQIVLYAAGRRSW